jgi:polyisoprenyl-phosphate glycosyltransferase
MGKGAVINTYTIPPHPLRAVPRVSVVSACYNEETNLPELHARVTAACVQSVGQDYELVLVNDGSKDGTWAMLKALADKDPRLVGVNLSRNHGHQLALTAGLSVCRGDRVLIIDSDLQDPPELLGEMMRAMDGGAEIVYGQRVKREGETAFKKASAALFYRIFDKLVDIDIPLDTGDFRLISRRALDLLNRMPEHHRFVRGMVSWIGFRQEAIPYMRHPRHSGGTKYPLSKMIRFALDAITGFSIRPLRVASYIGMATGVIGMTMLLYVVASWLAGETIQGWTSLMAVVILIGSAQLFVIGLMGEYLGRLYMEAKRRPLFVIESIICGDQTLQSPMTLDHESR